MRCQPVGNHGKKVISPPGAGFSAADMQCTVGLTRLFGASAWTGYLARLGSLNPELELFWVSTFYGKIMTRKGLDDRTKELILAAAFSALNRIEELRLHLRGALRCGASEQELEEVLFQVGLYAGSGAIGDGLKALEEIRAASIE